MPLATDQALKGSRAIEHDSMESSAIAGTLIPAPLGPPQRLGSSAVVFPPGQEAPYPRTSGWQGLASPTLRAYPCRPRDVPYMPTFTDNLLPLTGWPSPHTSS
jgi:hypothetical protein